MKKIFLFFCFSVYLFAEATIFVYHRFGDERPHLSSTNTPLDELRSNFEYFEKNGYEVVPLSKLVDALKNGDPIEDNWVVLTIDDSYLTFYENGLEIFKEYAYHFTLFVQSETLLWQNSREYMNKDMVLEAAKYGDIECHSHKHDFLPTKDKEYIKADTQKCIDIFEDLLDITPRYYTYPYGSYNDEVKQIIKGFGFEAILNQSNGNVNEKSDRFNLFRVALVGNIDNFAPRLAWNYLDATWDPIYYPKDGVLQTVSLEVEDGVDLVQLFVSDYGWSDWIAVEDGRVTHTFDLELKRNLVRVFVKDEKNRFNSVVLTKGDIHGK